MALGRKDKSDFFNRSTQREKLEFQIDEAKDMEKLWRDRRIELQR